MAQIIRLLHTINLTNFTEFEHYLRFVKGGFLSQKCLLREPKVCRERERKRYVRGSYLHLQKSHESTFRTADSRWSLSIRMNALQPCRLLETRQANIRLRTNLEGGSFNPDLGNFHICPKYDQKNIFKKHPAPPVFYNILTSVGKSKRLKFKASNAAWLNKSKSLTRKQRFRTSKNTLNLGLENNGLFTPSKHHQVKVYRCTSSSFLRSPLEIFLIRVLVVRRVKRQIVIWQARSVFPNLSIGREGLVSLAPRNVIGFAQYL